MRLGKNQGRAIVIRWQRFTADILKRHATFQASLLMQAWGSSQYAAAVPCTFSTQSQHVAADKITNVERGMAHRQRKVGRIGPHSARWAQSMLTERGIPGVRGLVGRIALANVVTAIHRGLAWPTKADRGGFHPPFEELLLGSTRVFRAQTAFFVPLRSMSAKSTLPRLQSRCKGELCQRQSCGSFPVAD